MRALYVLSASFNTFLIHGLTRTEQVKADRGEIKDANATIKQLQEETAKAAEQEKKNSSQ